MEASIDKLSRLAATLAHELEQPGRPDRAELSPEQRLCKETLMSIRVLLPKLRTASWARKASEVQESALRCDNCDE
jgi:hypothetical protein